MSSTVVSHKDVCLVCGLERDQHGDVHHRFNMLDDQLIPINPGSVRREEPPKSKTEAHVEEQIRAKSLATLVEVLAEKGILDSKDIIRILT